MTCIIVRQGAFKGYDRLHAAIGDLVPIIWDRRRARTRSLAHAETAPSLGHPNRRTKPPLSWTTAGFVVVERSAEWVRDAMFADSGERSSTSPQWKYQFS